MKDKKTFDKIFPFLVVLIVGLGVALLAWLSGSRTDSDSNVIEINNTNAYWRGNEEALIVLTEFSDFQCPACRTFQPILKHLLSEYPSAVKLYYRHFPLPQHPFAQKAAEAAEAAGEQGKFWEMHDMLFDDQENISMETLKPFAKSLELDMARFSQALDSGKFRQKVISDLNEGRELGVNSTPSLFINGKKVKSGISYEDLRGLIEEELQNEQK